MQTKIVSSRNFLIVVFLGFALSAAFLSYFVIKDPAQRGLTPPTADTSLLDEQISSELPVRLKIPKINIDAKIDPMGLTSDGAMEVPKGGRDVGWYSSGPRPGEIGSAVMDGHYGRWKNGEGSVFDDLNKLEKGDTVYVEDDKGVTTTFVVRELRTYDPNADALDVFSSDDGKSHLNLITCEGVWNKVSKSYSGRLVVFTDKE
jgi:LPXTG-site transpeptidase (sortase) family protein